MKPLVSVILLLVMINHNLDLVRGQEIDTANGRVRGRRTVIGGKALDIYEGIPYAEPPVGDLRFKYPRQVRPWRPEVKDATSPKASCMQSRAMYTITLAEAIYDLPGNLSEDCLYLNVWKPETANKASPVAVMVWIYGGGFSVGSISVPVYNGANLAVENDVIVVSMNYRLGVFGYGYLSSDMMPGNMGSMDQVEALRWVKNNIQDFGGDPNRITIFGESAGSLSVGFHLLSPMSRDLFNRGILQSGSPIQSIEGSSIWPKSDIRGNVKKLAMGLGCSGTSDVDIHDCLKAADPVEMVKATDSGGLAFLVINDETFLPKEPLDVLKAGGHKKTGILIGTNKDETSLFTYMFLFPSNRTLRSTGKVFGAKDVEFGIQNTAMIQDKNRVDALKTFYLSQERPPLDYLKIVATCGTDVYFKCAARKLSLFYSESNNVYMYAYNHRMSSTIQPEWMGVPHAYEIPMLLGIPLDERAGFTAEEATLHRTMGIYWSNFAKSGDPNLPVSVDTHWPVYTKDNETYLALDVGAGLGPRHWFRHHECTFVNDILPLIPSDDANTNVPTTPGSMPYPNGSDVINGSVLLMSVMLYLQLKFN